MRLAYHAPRDRFAKSRESAGAFLVSRRRPTPHRTSIAILLCTEDDVIPRHPSKPDCGCAERAQDDPFLSWVGRLVHDHRGRLVAVARAEGLGPEDAFDAVQEAFRHLPDAARGAHAGRRARRFAQPAGRRDPQPGAQSAPTGRAERARTTPIPTRLAALPRPAAHVEELLAAAEDRVRLRGCVATLGEMQRAVVTLRMLDEIDGEDVAARAGNHARARGGPAPSRQGQPSRLHDQRNG